MTIGGEVSDTCNLGINLWEEFPDAFIDYDAFNIARAIDLYKNNAGLYNPSSLTINGDASTLYGIDEYKDIQYYKVCLNAMNRVGGYVNNDIIIVYNKTTGKMDIINENGSYIIRQGAIEGKINGLTLSLLSIKFDTDGTQIWGKLIEKAME